MGLKLISKNNMGIILIILLVLIMSRTRNVKFLLDTYLGRSILLIVIIFISYTNVLSGLFAVLVVILAFNKTLISNVFESNYYYEGFNVLGSAYNKDNKQTANIDETKLIDSEDNKDICKGREGSCMSERELYILRGKQSNSVPILNNLRDDSEDVEPSEKSIFSNSYASI